MFQPESKPESLLYRKLEKTVRNDENSKIFKLDWQVLQFASCVTHWKRVVSQYVWMWTFVFMEDRPVERTGSLLLNVLNKKRNSSIHKQVHFR